MPDGSSGTYDFTLTGADATIEAFERIQIPSSALPPDRIISARRSANLICQRWANRGVNLWAVDLLEIPMIQGIAQYTLPRNTACVYDVYIRTYQIGSPVNLTPSFTTAAASRQVTVNMPNSGALVGTYIQIVIQIAVGGIVLSGFYQVTSTPSANSFTIDAAALATGTVTAGGVVPVFTTANASALVSVALAAHGLVAGDTFAIPVSTTIGGVPLQGDYTVATVTDANTFTITAQFPANGVQTVPENGGLTQIGVQVQNADPTDIMVYPLSRNDYAMIPDKFVQGRPTTFWYDRTITPTMNMWQVPNANQPYALMIYRMRTLQDFNPRGDQTLDMPNRFLEAFVSALAAALAEKFKPEAFQEKEAKAMSTWLEAEMEDREKVSTFMGPDMTGYFNG